MGRQIIVALTRLGGFVVCFVGSARTKLANYINVKTGGVTEWTRYFNIFAF